MKSGLVMVISAVSLFTATVIWSAFKEVPHHVYRYDVKEQTKAQTPDSTTAQSCFFQLGKIPNICMVDGPLSVELDNGFAGIELRGDTSLFKHIWVVRDKNTGGGIRIGIVRLNVHANEKAADSLSERLAKEDFTRREAVRKGDVTVRLGIGTVQMRGPGYRHFTFSNCKKISTPQVIRDRALNISVFQTDSVWMNLDVNELTLDFPNFAVKNTQFVHLEGKSKRTAINNFSGGSLDASQMISKDLYMYNSKEANIHIYASDLARLRQMEKCNIQVEGNPPYQWIEGME
ncbi:MAG: hypothetical protein IT262_03910 [Saprospiraceae bacterium]|nr:hypothetical protein [Saprospiraceae bacterium]